MTTQINWTSIQGVCTLEDTVVQHMAAAEEQWLEQMIDSGAVNAIVKDYKDAINKQLPVQMDLASWGHSDAVTVFCFREEYPKYFGIEENDSVADFIRGIVEDVDLDEIIKRHDVDLLENA